MGDAPLTSLGFNDTAFTVIDCNMTGVNDDIAGLCGRKAAYASSYIRPFSRCQVVTAVYAAADRIYRTDRQSEYRRRFG